MSLFSISAQVAGRQLAVKADSTARGIAVESASGTAVFANLRTAIDHAGQTLGPYLERARRNGAPWGLHVDACGYQAVYGDWPLLSVNRPREKRPTPLDEIYARYRPQDGPIAALNNALLIAETFAKPVRQAA